MRVLHRIRVLAALATTAALSAASASAEVDILKKAWNEYKLGEYATAEGLFESALQSAKNNDDYAEAATGVAFCNQFAKKQQLSESDYRAAIEVYQTALKKIGENSKYTPFLKSMLAECHFRVNQFSGDKDELEKASKLWEEVQTKWPETLAAQDALIFQVIAMTGDDYSTPQAAKYAEKLEKWITAHSSLSENNPKRGKSSKALSSVMCAYLADYHCCRGDRKTQVEWLIKYCDFGATSYAAKADALFKIARTAEIKLKDAKLAVKYYHRFLKEIGSDSRRYLAQERIKAILNGGVK
jgi:tetratricopeptide (TPR) repeat protein